MRLFVTGGTGFVGSPAAGPVRFAEIDSGAIAALGEALAGTGKPLVAAAGLPSVAPGVTATDDDKAPHNPPRPGQGRLGLRRRGRQRLVGGAPARRGPAVPPGAGAGARRDAAEHGRGRGRAVQRRRHAIGRSLNLPVKSVSAEEAAGHFGMPLAIFAQLGVPASSKRTRERCGWEPAEQPGLIEDIEQGHYVT